MLLLKWLVVNIRNMTGANSSTYLADITLAKFLMFCFTLAVRIYSVGTQGSQGPTHSQNPSTKTYPT